jgi:hypothetical protein
LSGVSIRIDPTLLLRLGDAGHEQAIELIDQRFGGPRPALGAEGASNRPALTIRHFVLPRDPFEKER